MPTAYDYEEWNEGVRRDNARYMEEATKSREEQLVIANGLLALCQQVMLPYLDNEGEGLSPQIESMLARVRELRREILEEKIGIELLGQSLPAFQVILPEWAFLSNYVKEEA